MSAAVTPDLGSRLSRSTKDNTMKMCQPHWDKLRQAIKDRGIYFLVAGSSEQAISNIVADLKGEPSDYDPLMDCHWMITKRALELWGLQLMWTKEDGTDYCPVCEAERHGATESIWIDGPADSALKFCRQKGLVPPAPVDLN
jgi:hypothetical protein